MVDVNELIQRQEQRQQQQLEAVRVEFSKSFAACTMRLESKVEAFANALLSRIQNKGDTEANPGPEDPIEGNRSVPSEGPLEGDRRKSSGKQKAKNVQSDEILEIHPTEDLSDLDKLTDTEEQPNTSSDEILTMFDEVIEEGDYGPDLKESLANRIKATWQKDLDKDKFKEKLKNIKTPKNCLFLETKRTNEEIYRELKQGAIAQDIKRQKEQRLLTKAAIPMMGILETVTDIKVGQPLTKEQITNLKQNAVNSVTMLASLNQKMEQGRRDTIVSTMQDHFKPLRKLKEHSTLLFGEDIVPKLGELKKSSSLLKQQQYQSRYHPYNRNSSSYSSKQQYQKSLNDKTFQNKNNAPGKGYRQGQYRNQSRQSKK